MSKTDELKKLAKKITGEEPNVRRASNVVEFIADHISGDIQNTDTISDSIAYLTEVYEGGGSDESIAVIDMSKFKNGGTFGQGLQGATVELNNLDCTGLTSLQYLMSGYSNVTKTALLNTNSVTNFQSAFNGASSLIEVNDFDTSNATTVQYMFSGCVELVTLPVFNLSKVPASWNNFVYNCPKLSNTSLQNVLKSLLTYLNQGSSASNAKKLLYVGLSETQANICVTFPEWTTLSTEYGWVTGY